MLTRRIARSEDEARIEARATPAECDGMAVAPRPAGGAFGRGGADRAAAPEGGGWRCKGRVAARLRRPFAW